MPICAPTRERTPILRSRPAWPRHLRGTNRGVRSAKLCDLNDADFSDVDDHLIATYYYDDHCRIVWQDRAFEADYNWLASKLPGMDLTFDSHTSDEMPWHATIPAISPNTLT